MIVYAVIARASDAAVLCEFSSEAMTTGGNVAQVTTSLLEHLRDHPAIMKEGDLKTFRQQSQGGNGSGGDTSTAEDDFFGQFLHACTVAVSLTDELDLGDVEEYFFHLWHKDDVFYCCLSDDRDPDEQKVNFAFLQALSHDFGGRYTKRRIRNANSYAMDKEFKSVLRAAMHHYNINRKELSQDARVHQLRGKVEDLKTLLGRNLTLLLEREQQLDSLMVKSEKARRDSMVFKRKSIRLKETQRMKSYKMWFLIFFCLLVMFYTIITSICGFQWEHCRASSSSTSTSSSGSSSDTSSSEGGGGN